MDQILKRILTIVLLVVTWGLISAGKDACGSETPKEFFKGKTITWIFSGDAGSSGDLMIRTIAPFLTREIGARVKVEYRGTEEGINYVYNQGSRDGLTLCTKTSNAIIGNDILKAPGVQYESDKFNFIADVYPTIYILQISPKIPYKTLEALRKAKGLKTGATSVKGAFAIGSAVMLELLGLDGKIITGFKGKKELSLAVARGEIDFIVSTDGGAMKDERDGFVVNLLAMGNKRSASVPQVPSLSELGLQIPKGMEAAHKFAATGGTAVVLPPGVTPERVEYLRKTFQTLSNNEDLQKAIEKLTGDRRSFLPGNELQQTMVEIKSDKELAAKLDALFKKYTAVR